jgi:methylenetetrahydrofolate dehydrogenase (NADP+)/methenyltetrahydrofolate cyclohydrolase
MTILDGKKLASELCKNLHHKILEITKLRGYAPHLCVILVGNDPASHTYVNAKRKACLGLGCNFSLKYYEDISEEHLLNLIKQINCNATIDGIIVQLPLLAKINVQKVLDSIDPKKDVDGFNSLNYGRMARGLPAHIPATPLGILKLLKHYKIKISGKHCVIVGRGHTVGAPLSILMGLDNEFGNATVTVCHRHTEDLKSITLEADILVAAAGQPYLITADMIKPNIVIIDVGINRITDPTKKSGYRLQGDVDYTNIAPICSHITPVPGGVGPMTIAALLSNTVDAAYERSLSKN